MNTLKVPVIFIIMMFFLVGCVSSGMQNSYEIAKTKDKIQTYEAFLQNYPDSENRPGVEKRISELREQEAIRKEKIEEKNKMLLGRLKGYTIGKTTFKDFENDHWGMLFDEKGVIGLQERNVNTSKYSLLEGKNLPDKVSIFVRMAKESNEKIIAVCELVFENGILVETRFQKEL